MNAGIYRRLSQAKTTGEMTLDALARQQEACEAVVKARGWTVAETYADLESAWRGTTRDGYERMLEDLEAGTITAVVAWSLDRLARNRKDFWRLVDVLEATGAPLVLVKDGLDSQTDIGRMVMAILVDLAHLESKNTSARLRLQRQQAATAGRPNRGGKRPFGWQADRVTEDPREAGAIRWAADQVLSGRSLSSICRDLTDQGILTPTGNEWRANDLRGVLESPRTAGLRSYHGTILGKAGWEPILDRATWEQLRGLFTASTGARPSRVHLLVGLLFCGRCRAPLKGRPRIDGTRQYYCPRSPGVPGCGRIVVGVDPIEQWVTASVLHELAKREFRRALREAESDGVEREIAEQLLADEASLVDLGHQRFVSRTIDQPAYLAAKAELDQRIAAAKRRLSRPARLLDGLPTDAAALQGWWDAAELDQRRSVIAAAIRRITVNPSPKKGGRFDPDRLRPEWRVAPDRPSELRQ